MRDKIIVIGSLNYDIILKIPRMPELGENIHANETAFASGGKGADQAVQAAKLGVPVYMVGCVGQDFMGDFLLHTVQGYGVRTEYIRRVDAPSGMGIVHAMEDGGVFASVVRGANFQVSREDVDRAEALMDEAYLVVLQMEIPQEINRYAIDKARLHGCRVLMNTAPAAPLEEEYLKKCHILVMNEVEAGFYANQSMDTMEIAEKEAEKMSEKMGNTVIITMGGEGAVASAEGRTERIPAMKVNAVETTGAGDSFIGGLVYGVLHGMSIFDACRFGTKCSAVTVCRLGAQNSMPCLEEIV